MSEPRMALVWCPFDGADSARECARVLVAERLAACANIVPRMISVFEWQGETQETEEAGLLCKTEARLLHRLTARLAELHTYDNPAIAGWLVDHAPPATLSWLTQAVAAREVWDEQD